MIRMFALALCWFVLPAMAQAQCSGTRTPIRNLVAAKPVRTTVGGVLSRITTNRVSCGGASVKSSCAGTVKSSCAGSAVAPSAPTPQPVACSVYESRHHFVSTVSDNSSAYARAHASASYRAANSIRGHVRGEIGPGGGSAGVGWASANSNPRTCLGTPGQTKATCAVVRGRDGWYSTCVK